MSILSDREASRRGWDTPSTYTITNANDEWPIHTDSYTYAMHALYNRALSEGRADLIDRATGHHLILTDNT